MDRKSLEQKLAITTIERWVKQKKLQSPAYIDEFGNEKTTFTMDELFTTSMNEELLKRSSKPSYTWIENEDNKWWRVWFNEKLLTIQIDSHFANGKYQLNIYEIDLERCDNAGEFLDYLYHSSIGKQWGCPELLWAIMEVANEISRQKFNRKGISEVYLKNKKLI